MLLRFADRKMLVYKNVVTDFGIISPKCAKRKKSLRNAHHTMIYGEVQNTPNFVIYLCIIFKNKRNKFMFKIILESFPLLFFRDNKISLNC